MKPTATSSTVRAGAVLGFLTTAAIGWKLADQPQQAVVAHEEKATKAAGRPSRPARRSGTPTQAQQRMASIRAISSPAERMRATIDFANNMPVADIEKWLEGRWFDTGGGFELTLFNKILNSRWQAEDPEGFLLWGVKNNSSRTSSVLATLAEKDPQRVIDFFKEHPNPQVQINTLTEIAKKNPALALQGLKEMISTGSGTGSDMEYYNRNLLQELAKNSPSTLEGALDSLPPALKLQAETALIGLKLDTSFDAEFKKLLDRPDGLKIFQNLNSSKGLGDKLLDHLASLPPTWRSSVASNYYQFIGDTNSRKWLDTDLAGMGFTADEAMNIHSYALGALGRKQPEEAIKLMANAGLDANGKTNVLNNLFSRVTDQPEKAAALMALLTSDEDRGIAQKFLDSNVRESPVTKVEKPDDWLAKVSATDTSPGAQSSYLSMLRNWDPERIGELSNQFRSMPDDKKQLVAKLLVQGDSYSIPTHPELQGEAIRYLLVNPAAPVEGQEKSATSTALQQSSRLAVNWAKTDPTAAGEWVRSLPSGDARLWAQKNLAANWTQYDPQATEQWLKTLPVNEQTEVRKFMKTGENP